MSVTVTSLAEFKRFLARPGARVQIVRHDFVTNHKPGFFSPKQVERFQANAVRFVGGMWLQFGRAENYKFNGDEVTIALNNGGAPDPFSQVMVFKLTIKEYART